MKINLKVILIIIAAITTSIFYGCENSKCEEKNNIGSNKNYNEKRADDIVILEKNISQKDKNNNLKFNIDKSIENNTKVEEINKFKPKYMCGIIVENGIKIVKIKDGEKDTIKEIKLKKTNSNREENFKTNDGNNIYFLNYNEVGNRCIMHTSLDGEVKTLIDMNGKKDYILDFSVLKNGKIIFSGTFNNEKGLFYFNRLTKEVKTILKGRDIVYTISPDERKIIYGCLSSENKFNLYAGKLEEDKITSNELLYENVPQNILNCNGVVWEKNSRNALVVKLKEDKEVKEYYNIKFDEGVDEIENVVTNFITGFYTVNEEVYEKNNKIIDKVIEGAYTENDLYEGCSSIVPYASDELKSIIINHRLYPYKESLEEYNRKNVYYEVKDIGISNIIPKDEYITCECKFKLIKKVGDNKEVEEKEKTICVEWDVDRWVVNEFTRLDN